MNTKALRQKILDLAIRGKLVPQDPNDEPASVLLERIRAEKERLIAEGKIKRPKSKTSSSASPYQNLYELPKSWQWCQLGNFTDDLQYGTSEKSVANGEVAVLRMGNITRIGEIDYANLAYTSSEADIEKYSLRKGDLLFNRTNSSDWVGKTAFYDEKVRAIYAGYLIRIRPIHIDSEYLNIFMNSDYHRRWCQSVKTDAVNQSNINAQKLSHLWCPIPPLEEQKRITERVKDYIAKIVLIEKSSLDTLNSIGHAKSKILELAMQGKLVPQDPADEPAADMLRRINPKAKILTDIPHYPQLPDNWVITAFTDVCESRLGKTLNSEKDEGSMSPYLCALNVKQGHFDLSIIKQTRIQSDEYERYSVINGDLLVCEGGDVGRAAIWQGDRVCYQNALHRVRPLGNILQKYLYYSLLYSKNKNIIDDLCSGVTIKHFTTKSMSKLSISLPPIAEQRRIVDKIEELFSTLDKIEESLN